MSGTQWLMADLICISGCLMMLVGCAQVGWPAFEVCLGGLITTMTFIWMIIRG